GNDAAQVVNRIVDVFPGGQQQQIRTQLASTLSCVVHQELLPRIGGGRAAAFEVMMATSAVSNLIRDSKASQLRNTMLTSIQDGMCTLEMSLSALVQNHLITYDDAVGRSMLPKEIRRSVADDTPLVGTPAQQNPAPLSAAS